jgi:hypothetical protein
MKKEFVPHEIALALAKLKFNEKCFGYYGIQNELKIEISSNLDTNLTRRDFYAAPTYSQAFRWFREKHNLNGEVTYLPNVEKYGIITSDMTGMKPKNLSKNENFERGKKITNNFVKYETYEEAELECLKELIEIVKNKQLN